MIFGIRPVLESISAAKEVDRVLLQKGLRGELFQELFEKLKELDIPLQIVPIDRLNRITRKNHQGVIAFLSRISYHRLEQVMPIVYESGKTPLVLLLDHITDVRNFGAIARSAECAGVNAIILPSKGSAQINADAIKTSAGALHKIPVCRNSNLKETILYIKNSGLQIVAATEKAEKYHYDVDYSKPTAIILGSEEKGISDEYLKLCNEIVKIPMAGKIQSLNVSVAAGIIMFEVVKQRL